MQKNPYMDSIPKIKDKNVDNQNTVSKDYRYLYL